MLILFAVGGTGGHIFPAQALADELLECDPNTKLLFAGAKLSTNRFLDKGRFRFEEVISATPFRRNPLRACFLLLKGIYQSVKLFKREKPDLVVGFGSYHSFPLLFAAKLCKIPIVLFEADSFPGKVNRLFSRHALFTGVHFPHAASHLKGKAIPVAMPSKHRRTNRTLTDSQARALLRLEPQCFTLLVFGGSQGAKGINDQILALLPLLKQSKMQFQLIHITGNEEMAIRSASLCMDLGIASYVKDFEPNMGCVWKAATLVIGRSGASTLSEMIHFEVPGILIPYPHASDAHQHANARFLEKEVSGGVVIPEEKLKAETLCATIWECEKKLEHFKQSMRHYKTLQAANTFGKVIYERIAFH